MLERDVQHAPLPCTACATHTNPLFIRFKMKTYWVFSADPAHFRPIPRLALHASLQGCISLSHTFPAHHAHSSIARGFPGAGCRVMTLTHFFCRRSMTCNLQDCRLPSTCACKPARALPVELHRRSLLRGVQIYEPNEVRIETSRSGDHKRQKTDIIRKKIDDVYYNCT